jgi:glyoxylase I family protein
MLQVLGIDHVVLRVLDRERALAFYCGLLGMSIEREQPELALDSAARWQVADRSHHD